MIQDDFMLCYLNAFGLCFIIFVLFLKLWPADLEARERQAEAEAQKTEEFKITRTLEEEVRMSLGKKWRFLCFSL